MRRPSIKKLIEVEMATRRKEKELCYYYDEKFVLGHRWRH